MLDILQYFLLRCSIYTFFGPDFMQYTVLFRQEAQTRPINLQYTVLSKIIVYFLYKLQYFSLNLQYFTVVGLSQNHCSTTAAFPWPAGSARDTGRVAVSLS